jgi:hypothetical protein
MSVFAKQYLEQYYSNVADASGIKGILPACLYLIEHPLFGASDFMDCFLQGDEFEYLAISQDLDPKHEFRLNERIAARNYFSAHPHKPSTKNEYQHLKHLAYFLDNAVTRQLNQFFTESCFDPTAREFPQVCAFLRKFIKEAIAELA